MKVKESLRTKEKKNTIFSKIIETSSLKFFFIPYLLYVELQNMIYDTESLNDNHK